MPLYCGTGYRQTYVFAPPYLTLNVIFGLTFNYMFVLLCAIFVVVVVIYLFCFLFWLCGYTVKTTIICYRWILCTVQIDTKTSMIFHI